MYTGILFILGMGGIITWLFFSNHATTWRVMGWGYAFLLCVLYAEMGFGQVDQYSADMLQGEIINPLPSPSNPAIISFEQQYRNQRRLFFFDIREGSVTAFRKDNWTLERNRPAAQADTSAEIRSYTGDMDWRPVLDYKKRQWFAYVSNRDGEGMGLYLSWITPEGSISEAEPVKLPIDGEVQSPRWSPDGNSLVYVSSNQLFLITEMQHILKDKGVRPRQQFNPIPLTRAPLGLAHPAWSPDGLYLAFQITVADGKATNREINLLPMREVPGTSWVNLQPLRLTNGLTGSDEIKPAWSPTGEYIAYYMRPAGNDSSLQDSGLADIGVAQVNKDPTTGQIMSTDVRQGNTRYIDSEVIPNPYDGPDWRMYEDIFGWNLPALLYVRKDPGGIKIVESRVDEWLNHRSRYITDISSEYNFGEGDYSYVRMTWLPEGRRYVYVVQDDKTSKLEVRDIREGGNGKLDIRVDRDPRIAVRRSILFPGLGQFYKAQKGRGILFTTAEVLSLGALAYFTWRHYELKDDYDQYKYYYYHPEEGQNTLPADHYGRRSIAGAINHFYLEWDGAYQSLETNRTIQWITASTAVGIWLINIYDSSRGFPLQVRKELGQNQYNIKVQPNLVQARDSWAAGLRLTVSFK